MTEAQIIKKLETLTTRARLAHGKVGMAREARVAKGQRIQSTREMKARNKYNEATDILREFCTEHNIPTPRTF